MRVIRTFVLSQNDDDNNVYNGLYQRNNLVQLLDFTFSCIGLDLYVYRQ